MRNMIRFGFLRLKLQVTIRHLKRALLMARICALGTYKNSGWDGHHDYVDYEYKGKVYRLPHAHKPERAA